MRLSLLAGAGTSAVATMASLFIVEFDPQNEWEPRLGWLQTFNGGGPCHKGEVSSPRLNPPMT